MFHAASSISIHLPGWEKNAKGQPGPRLADMRSQMDPRALAESSSNMNLRLMKWRLAPGLDLVRKQSYRRLGLGKAVLLLEGVPDMWWKWLDLAFAAWTLFMAFFHHQGSLTTSKSSVEWSPHFCEVLYIKKHKPPFPPNSISELTNCFLYK